MFMCVHVLMLSVRQGSALKCSSFFVIARVILLGMMMMMMITMIVSVFYCDESHQCVIKAWCVIFVSQIWQKVKQCRQTARDAGMTKK